MGYIKKKKILNNKKKLEKTKQLSEIFSKLTENEDLTWIEAKDAATEILNDLTNNKSNTLVLLTAFFGGLTIKNPTIDELTGMATAMETTKKFTFHFNVNKPLVTAGGTGGDTVPTINATTPAVIVAASAGAYALKSGARAFSSKTGASDLAIALGININATRKIVEECVEKIGVTVWASDGVYPWMRQLINLRSKEHISTVMPFLYSLRLMIATALNPFSIKRQVRGVSKPFTETVAKVLSKSGYEKALVVLGYGKTERVKIDEYSNLGKNVISELKQNGSIDTYRFYPEDIGIERGKIEEVIARSNHIENAKIAVNILSGSDRSSRRDLILLNAASILFLADEVKDIKDGYELAGQAVDDGKGIKKLRQLVQLSKGQMSKLEAILNSLKQF